jgi:hypothetical protein
MKSELPIISIFGNGYWPTHSQIYELQSLLYIRVICKVLWLGGQKCQFRHNRASNMYLRIKILSNQITRSQTSFSSNFGGKLSFILSFLCPKPLHWCYIYFHLNPLQMTWISSQLEFMSTLQMVLKGEAFFEMPTTLCNLRNYVKHGILGFLVLVCLCFPLILFPSHVSIYMMQCGQWCSRLVPMCSWYIDHLIFDVKHQRCDYKWKSLGMFKL